VIWLDFGAVTVFNKFFRISRFSASWIGPVWVLLGISRAASFFAPSRRLMWSHGLQQRSFLLPLLNPAQLQKARQIRSVVALASRYTPWEANCFSQAGAVRFLFFVYGIPFSVFLGVRRHDVSGCLSSHIWIASDRVAVCGGRSFDIFSVVACFYYDGR